MTRRKKRPETKVPFESVQAVAREIQKRLPLYGSQKSMGEFLGVKQATVSRFLATVDEKRRRRDGSQPQELGSDVVASVAERLGIEWVGPRIGMRRAGVEESTDMLPNRGRALDMLSAEYPIDLLQAMKRHPLPPGHEGWTPIRFVEFFIELRKAWESGLVELPGLPRKNSG